MVHTRRWVLGFAALMASCVSLRERMEPGLVNAQPYVAPAHFEAWYHEVEACTGIKGDYSELRFFVADEIYGVNTRMSPGGFVLGYWHWHDIYYRRDFLLERLGGVVLERMVKHEMIHDVLYAGGGSWYEHQPRYFDECSQSRPVARGPI